MRRVSLLLPLGGVALALHLGACSDSEVSPLAPADSGVVAVVDTGVEPEDTGVDAHKTTLADLLALGCGYDYASVTRDPIIMSMVIDGSGSMDGIVSSGGKLVYDDALREEDPLATAGRPDFFLHEKVAGGATTTRSGKKWLALRSALNAFYDGIVAAGDTSYTIGAYLFSDPVTSVPIGAHDAAQANLLKSQVNPPNFAYNANTPLVVAMQSQVSALQAYGGAIVDAKRVMVVITDGLPNNSPDAKNTGVTVVTDARSAKTSVGTFVIGVGDPTADASTIYDEKYLGQLAVAGGYPATGCDPNWNEASPAGTIPCHFQVTPGARKSDEIRDDMSKALDSIRTRFSCELTLEKKTGLDPNKVNVVFTPGSGAERLVTKEINDGWSFDNETAPVKVILNGAACRDLSADTKSSVRLLIGCDTVL